MKDIPIFTGHFGMATLILREIPTKRCAYVMVRSHQPGRLRELLLECRDFCVMAGAARVLATADESVEGLAHVHDMLELTCRREALPPLVEPVALAPVTAENGGEFLRLYNRLFYTIENAATYTQTDLNRVLESGGAYLALADGAVAGMGELLGNELCALGVLPEHRGLGRRLALTLLDKLTGPVLRLRVSSVNGPALRLYEKLGFERASVLSSWYLVAATEE